PENMQLQLSAKEVSELCSIFALGMMADAAIWYNHPLDVSDKEFFTHNGAEYAYTLSDPDVKKRHRSFCPSNATLKNKRVDYFARLLQAIGKDADLNYINKNLEAIWNKIFLPSKLLHQSEGAYQIDTQKIVVSKGNHWYYCSKCKKLSAINIREICPTYQCTGHLTSVNVYDKYSGNHYFEMYQNMDARELRIFEHTAQLDKETAYDYQKRFKNKEVDILSCSTTFEMGVDVGSLETVFMRNMPPSPTNYAQRAGRAGRSKHAAAYALTFCNKSNHDFTFFRMPERMIRGEIDPPKFNIENEKIAIRHLYASALSFFWKRYSKFFSTVGVMAETNEAGKNGFICFESYLQEHPNELKDFAKKFLPLSLVDTFKIASYGWIGSLLSSEEDNPGVLIKAIAEYDYELGVLQDAVQLAIAAQRPIDHLNERIRVYKRENILAFLSRKNVLPKYGFPVDNVEMTIVDRNNNKKLGVQLQRDLSIAISEYAPGSQIVANGRLITSHYIRKIPKMSWKMFDYIRCVECKTLNIAPHSDTPAIGPLETCQVCNASLNNQARETFLIPLFGFASNDIKKPGLIKPERTYNGEVSYVGYMEKINMERYQIAGRTVELGVGQGQEMAVLNESAFYICESCGYTLLDESAPQTQRIKKHKHHSLNGYTCANDGTNKLRKYSLGYQFKTDVVQIRFISLDLWEWEVALSVLYGFLNGICSSLNIESTDISGCLQHFKNEETHHGNFALILYDKTPGGAGHVRRLNSPEILTSVINETIRLMESCNCGGDEGDSSCYSCLRNYYNQKQHDVLKRGYVIRFLKELQV
ncbi:MAG: helicase-related protein, partial [Clostridiaceae bacterium]|nr:helicase-related protein [Clostridiaceae bacterium]